MHAARACLILALAGCAPAPALWRDQYIFVGDDATALCVGLDRRSSGAAEAKAWLGAEGRWRYVYYDAFALAGSDPASLVEAAARLSGPGTRLRVEVSPGDGPRMRIRLPHAAIELSGTEPGVAVETIDPEGASELRAGRAELRMGARATPGWLLVDTTPPARPKVPFVDYGDFVLMLVSLPDGGLLVAKSSLERPEFDRAFEFPPGGGAPIVRRVLRIEREAATLTAFLDGVAVPLRAALHDVRSSSGVAPDGSAVLYEALLLDRGVAFTIRPRAEVD